MARSCRYRSSIAVRSTMRFDFMAIHPMDDFVLRVVSNYPSPRQLYQCSKRELPTIARYRFITSFRFFAERRTFFSAKFDWVRIGHHQNPNVVIQILPKKTSEFLPQAAHGVCNDQPNTITRIVPSGRIRLGPCCARLAGGSSSYLSTKIGARNVSSYRHRSISLWPQAPRSGEQQPSQQPRRLLCPKPKSVLPRKNNSEIFRRGQLGF